MAAQYGGGIFLLIYILLALTFGYTMIMAETAIGRMTRKSPAGAFTAEKNVLWTKVGGWINSIIPMLIVPYYSVIGGWVIKYLLTYLFIGSEAPAQDAAFTNFVSSYEPVLWFAVFSITVTLIIYLGVRNGIERVSRILMPILIGLSIIIAIYSMTRPGAVAGIKYFLVPNLENLSLMTVVTAMGQMFYSLSIAMGILITFGSYMKKEVSIEESTDQVEIFDTAIAILSGLMIIPAVFAFSGADASENLNAGPSLMFITMPKVFHSMGFGRVIGALFFVLVLFAALTSAVALFESAVSTFQDEFPWSRKKATIVMGIISLGLGSLYALGFGPLSGITILGMDFLDFFDFLTNSIMMPLAALAVCALVVRVIGLSRIDEEVMHNGAKFARRPIFHFMIKYLCPLMVIVILVSSILNAFGVIHM